MSQNDVDWEQGPEGQRPLSQQELQNAIARLDQARYNHEQWHKGLMRTLIARLPPDDADMGPDAPRRCRFGQWCGAQSDTAFAADPSFQSIGNAHDRMHASATRLLQRVEDDLPLAAADLDEFDNLLDQLRLRLDSLRRELVETVENRDPLTGARNRVGLLHYLREQQALVRRQTQDFSLALFDLDHFKSVNDTYGHTVGDEVLARFADSVLRRSRGYDRLYRYGGEEFLLCLPNTGIQVARSVVERLRLFTEERNDVLDRQGQPVPITVSVGLAALEADVPAEECIQHADDALYRAKDNGRNRVYEWSDI
ncbi:MAG: diguanylate cyclase [Actinobacteria bacterium]|nr:diguanylate cyclase [Actinomycetota bacterium]